MNQKGKNKGGGRRRIEKSESIRLGAKTGLWGPGKKTFSFCKMGCYARQQLKALNNIF